MIISTGMGTLGEVETAINKCKDTGNDKTIILHCVSNYPPKTKDCNLLSMKTIGETFDVLVGYSDHTIGIEVPLAAVTLGACVIEKHFTTDKTLPGWDHPISANPKELKDLVDKAKIIQDALGSSIKQPVPAELEMIKSFRRSAITNRPIKKGEVFKRDMIDIKRPGTGFEPELLHLIIGRKSAQNIKEDTVIMPEHLGELN